jgi:hypothetical protein
MIMVAALQLKADRASGDLVVAKFQDFAARAARVRLGGNKKKAEVALFDASHCGESGPPAAGGGDAGHAARGAMGGATAAAGNPRPGL